MANYRLGLIGIVLFAFLLISGSSHAANRLFIVSFTDGRNVILMKVTKTDTGIQSQAPVVHSFGGRVVGSTAVDAILDSAGNLVKVNVYVSYVGAGNLPFVSLLTFDSQLSRGGSLQFVNETALPKLKLGQYFPLHVVEAGTIKRLFAAGPRGGAAANDYFGYNLNSAGVATGTRKLYFKNPAGISIFGGSASRTGDGIINQVTVNPPGISPAASPNPHTVTTGPLANGNPSGPKKSETFLEETGYSGDCDSEEAEEEDEDGPFESGTRSSSVVTNESLIFRRFRNLGTANAQSQILIQRLDPNGSFIGQATQLTAFVKALLVSNEVFQSIAMGPNLLLYSAYSGSCKKQLLRAQRIELANARRVGAPKTLYACGKLTQSGTGVYGIDIDSLELD